MRGLTDDGRVTLAIVADALIPASADMPAASGAEVQGRGIDLVLRERPDLQDAVLTAAAAPVGDAAEAKAWAADLETRDRATFDALLEAVAAAYFLDPGIARTLGYRRREPLPVVFDTDLDELTAPVTARGPIYRTVT